MSLNTICRYVNKFLIKKAREVDKLVRYVEKDKKNEKLRFFQAKVIESYTRFFK